MGFPSHQYSDRVLSEIGFEVLSRGSDLSRIGRKYLTRYVNKTVRLYFCDAGDQLTKRSIKSKASGWIFYADTLNDDLTT